MTRMLPRTLYKVLLACLAAVLITTATPAPVVAQPQRETVVEPPRPRRADKAPILTTIFAGVIIFGAVFGANMIPSKRGHQD